MAKTLWSFDHSECNRVKVFLKYVKTRIYSLSIVISASLCICLNISSVCFMFSFFSDDSKVCEV